MKKKTLFIRLIFLCAGLFLFVSCSNIIDSTDSAALKGEVASTSGQNAGQKFTFNGTLCVTCALPASLNQVHGDSLTDVDSASRSALPSFTIGTNYFYYVIATQKDGNGSVRINSIDNAEAFSLSSGVTFNLELSIGSWEIKCGICDRDSLDFLMSDTYQFTISDTNLSINHTFYPKPSQKGNGTVALQISYESGMVDSITAKCGNNSWSVTISETQATIEKSSINSGAYDLSIYFFKDDDQGNSLPVYATNQTINVFDNMTTNTWVSDGSGLINGSGAFTLTTDLIDQFARTTFYVGKPASLSSRTDVIASNSNPGTAYSPLETIDAAIARITATGDNSKDYKIFISGEITGNTIINPTVASKARSISICGLSGFNEQGNPKDALIGNGNGNVLDVMMNASLKDIAIKGGATGLNVGMSGTNVIIESGVLITGCKRGANVYGGGSLTMKGGKIRGNKGVDQGAGVKVSGASFAFNNGEISENEASGNGGGVYVETGASFSMTGGTIKKNKAVKGGGIYSANTSITISDGTITENEATEKGGGVIIGTSLTITGGEISKNTAPIGGAILVNYSTLILKENAYIPYGDKNGSKGAGKNDICLEKNGSHDSFVTLAGGLSAHSESAPVAITHDTWARGKVVVKADSDLLDLTPYKDYFTFTQDGWMAKVSDDKKTLTIDAPIFVAGQLSHPYCGVAGNDETGTGTKAKPFETIEKAITLMNDKTTDYTILIDGAVNGAQKIPNNLTKTDSGTYKAQSVTIEGVNGLDENGEPKDSLNGKSGNSVTRPLNIKSEVPVKITNLKITEGYTAGNGGGIYIDTGTTVLLGDGVLVTGNTAASGGGIYNLGKLFLYGSAMVGKETDTVATSTSYGNKATVSGAGIYNQGSLYLGYSSWTSETEYTPCVLTGGVCGNYNADTDYSTACGGGIYSGEEANIKIASGNISYNYAHYGAGVYTEGAVAMTGGTIEGNEGDNNYSTGGGIYVYESNGSFSMSGDSVIKNNRNITYGAGVYIFHNSSFEMTGGTIENNTAILFGGAIYLQSSTESIYADLSIGADAYIPYGGEEKNNDIHMTNGWAKIKISSSLAKHSPSNQIMLHLHPNYYTEGKQALLAESGVTLADEVGKFTTSPDSLGKQWSIDSDGKLSGIMVVSISKEELSSFIPNSSTVYNIITDSSFGNDEIASLLSKINDNVGEGTVLNLADATATSINKKIYGKMTSVVLPLTCTNLTSQIFESAYYLEEIRVSGDNTAFSTENGILYDKNKTKLISYPAAKPGDTFNLPSSVTKLGYAAFRNNKYLETINGLSRIQELADMVIFADTQKLKEIDLSGLTQSSLPYYTFTRSQALEKVTLSSSITNIGLQCFQDTSTLTEVHFKSTTSPTFAKPSKTEDLEYYKNFKNCPNVKFYVPSSAVDTYKNATLERGFTNTDYNGAASTTEEIRNKIFGE